MVTPLVFGPLAAVFFAKVLRGNKEDTEEKEKMNPEEAKALYSDFEKMLKSCLSTNGLSEYFTQTTSDPWSPWLYYLTVKEKKKFLGIRYKRDVIVAEIESLPVFAKDYREVRMPCDGLEIRIGDPEIKPAIEGFCKEYSERFNEKPKITLSYKA